MNKGEWIKASLYHFISLQLEELEYCIESNQAAAEYVNKKHPQQKERLSQCQKEYERLETEKELLKKLVKFYALTE